MKLCVVKKFVPGSLFLRGQMVVYTHITLWADVLRIIEHKNVEEWWIE